MNTLIIHYSSLPTHTDYFHIYSTLIGLLFMLLSYLFRNIIFLTFSSVLIVTSGCAEKSNKIKEGKKLFSAGNYAKSVFYFREAVQLDPKDTEAHFQLAEALTKLGDAQNAANQYLAVLAEDPKNNLAKLNLGQLLLSANQVDNAEKIANELLANDPTNMDAKILLVNVLILKNNTDNAITELNVILNKQPDNLQANLLLASIQFKIGRTDQSIASLQKISEKHSNDISSLSLLANIYLQLNESDKAKMIIESIIKIEPKKLEHRKSLMLYLVANKKIDDAEQVLRTAVEELSDDVNAKLLLVDFLYDKRSPEIAMTELLPLIDQFPENIELRFELVKLELAQNHTDKAEEALKEIIDLDKSSPNTLKAQTQLTSLLLSTQRVNEAKELNSQILKDHPQDLGSIVLRGEIALVERKLNDAINDFRSVLIDQPQNVPVLKLLSTAHIQNNDPVLAKENLQKILAITPNDESAAVELANVLLKTGAKEQASQLIETIVKEHPKSKLALQGAYNIYSIQKQWDKTQDFAKRIQSTFSDEGVGFYLSGLGYQAEGKIEAGIKAFEQALSKQPDSIEPMTQLIRSYISLKQSDKAITTLTESLKQRPKNFIFLNMLGSIYLNDKKFDDAVSAFNKASIIKPDWTVPYHMLAIAYNAQNKKTDALQALKLGLTNTKSNLELVNDLASMYNALGDHDKAILTYEEAYKLNPNSLDLLNNLVIYLTEFGKDQMTLDNAYSLSEPLRKLDNIHSLDTIGWLNYKLGKYNEAKEIMLKVIAINPELPASNYHLGMIYYQSKDTDNAIKYLQKAIAKNSDFYGFSTAKETLATLTKSIH